MSARKPRRINKHESMVSPASLIRVLGKRHVIRYVLGGHGSTIPLSRVEDRRIRKSAKLLSLGDCDRVVTAQTKLLGQRSRIHLIDEKPQASAACAPSHASRSRPSASVSFSATGLWHRGIGLVSAAYVAYNHSVPARRSPLEERLLPLLRKRQEAHGRELAADLAASPGAIAKALDRMERRGLASSRWVGRSRLYRAADLDAGLVEEARRRLSSCSGIEVLAVLPFGSRATGRARPDSDLDLVVVVPDEEATNDTWQRLRQALRGLNVPIDLLVYPRTEAKRWAPIPGTPLAAALRANPNSKEEIGL